MRCILNSVGFANEKIRSAAVLLHFLLAGPSTPKQAV